MCHVDEALWFLSASCKSPALDAGRKREARSYRFSGEPKPNRIHRDTQLLAVSSDRQSVHRRGHKTTDYNALACDRVQMAIAIVTSHWSHHKCIMYMTVQQMISSNSPVLASSFQAGSSKYCRASRAQKWLYLSWNNSESSYSSCVGFLAGPTIARKFGY